MLDIKFLRDNPAEAQRTLDRRHGGYSIEELITVDKQSRELQADWEALNRRSNEISEQFKTGKVAKEQMDALRRKPRSSRKARRYRAAADDLRFRKCFRNIVFHALRARSA